MVIMALDHTRDFFHAGAMELNPTDMATTTPALFFTRWITHFCAPIFVLLSGTSAFLYGNKNGKKDVSIFLLTRGIWLIILEITVVRLGWTFNIFFDSPFMLQVIWAIGCSMIALSVLVWLNKYVILAIGLLIVFGHNFLDPISFEPSQTGFIPWGILHDPSPIQVDGLIWQGRPPFIFVLYPILPWIGVMACGYSLGQLYTPNYNTQKRSKILVIAGASALVIFFVLRGFNIYGNPEPWAVQKNRLFTFMSILNNEKYPPSLLFLLMTIGPGLLSLVLFEKLRGWLAQFFIVIGRVPLFYYLMHLYLIHVSALFIFFVNGGSANELSTEHSPFGFPPTFGFALSWVYVAWICIVLMLYPLCRWYGNMKARSTWKGWSYL